MGRGIGLAGPRPTVRDFGKRTLRPDTLYASKARGCAHTYRSAVTKSRGVWKSGVVVANFLIGIECAH